MKRILTLAGLATCALIFLQCSQSTPISPDLFDETQAVQANHGGRPGGPHPTTQGESPALPGTGP